MISAPINPSDYLLKDGIYPAPKNYPYVAGFEGYGEVVEVGDSKYQKMKGLKGNLVIFDS